MTFLREQELHKNGYRLIAGVDEAGRGPLAGPVVAAAVILPDEIESHLLAGIRDSKQLNENTREHFYRLLTRLAKNYAIGQASPREIEEINIRQASLLAMKRAIEKLNLSPDYILVDGRDYPNIDIPGETIIKGDERSISIGAASIIAKVIRDRIMTSMHTFYPDYGFDQHKGYPTKYHRIALQLFGASHMHRNTFSGVIENTLIAETRHPFQESLKAMRRCQSESDVEACKTQIETKNLSEKERFYLEHHLQAIKEKIREKTSLALPNTREKGSGWEHFALRELQKKGYMLWEKNFKGHYGEIDLIVCKGAQIVFVEVKARTSKKFGTPNESVTKRKQKAIIQTAEEYLYRRDLHEGWDLRYDVISIYAPKGEKPVCEHIKDAFRVEEEIGE